jgi:hypothetical protein
MLTGWIDHRERIIYEVVTERLKWEPNFIFKSRHKLKVKAKKYWLKHILKKHI